MSAANWKVGDKILCVDAIPLDSDSGFPTGLKAGEEYEILDKHTCVFSFVCVGTPVPHGFYYSCCPGCTHTARGTVFHYAWRFVKLDPDMKVTEDEYQFVQPISPNPQELQKLLEQYK